MQASIAQWTHFRTHMFRAVQGRLDHLVDHTPFCDELAAQIGCKPPRWAVWQEGMGFRLRFFAAPFVAAQYRLVGPHAKPWITREVISRLPIMHPLPTSSTSTFAGRCLVSSIVCLARVLTKAGVARKIGGGVANFSRNPDPRPAWSAHRVPAKRLRSHFQRTWKRL
jgi:hypothetical protein